MFSLTSFFNSIADKDMLQNVHFLFTYSFIYFYVRLGTNTNLRTQLILQRKAPQVNKYYSRGYFKPFIEILDFNFKSSTKLNT